MSNIISQLDSLQISEGPSSQDISMLSSKLSKLSDKDLYISQAGLQQSGEDTDVFLDSLYMMALIVFGK